MVELRALGTSEIHTESSTLRPSQTIVFAAALYMIMERRKPVSRDRLASLLWPSIKRKDQTHRLRQTVYQLKALGVPIRSDRNTLALTTGGVRTDLDEVYDSNLRVGSGSELLEFLPGYAPNLSPEFGDWLDTARDSVHSSLTRIFVSAIRDARSSGNWGDVERTARHCLRLDPYNEAAVLAQAEACAMRGQKATAVSILDRYVAEVGPANPTLVVPATVLRRRVIQVDERRRKSPPGEGEPGFVGRRPELVTLTQFLENARKGAGAGCLIIGQAGIGKTRLSSEIAKFAELQGVTVERVACIRADTDQPLSAFVTLIPKLRDLPGALGCSRQNLLWLKRLTEFDTSGQEIPVVSDDSTVLYTHLRSAVFDILDAVSEERCLLVIVEDIQWLDKASARLFGGILEWISTKKILFLFNSRETHNPLVEAASFPRIAVTSLDPLGDSEATSLVRTMISTSGESLGSENIEWLVNTCDGNPYFLQELTKHWIESGERHQIPASVATVLDERISRLSEVARQLLQTCAILGEHSNFERIEEVLGHSPQDLLRAIQELSLAGMVRTGPPTEGATQTLFVKHDLLSIEVIKTLAPASLAFLHRRCGVVLEREAFGKSISISLVRACAFHWHQSGDSERAYRLAIKCADHLLEIGLAGDAAIAFEGALVFCSTVDRRLEILGRIVQAHRTGRDFPALLMAIGRFRSLQEAGAPNGHHDDIEVTELEALRTTETDLESLLARTLCCVYDDSLPAAHRVMVAAVAVKLASSVPDLVELEHVYQVVKPLLEDGSVAVRVRLQLHVIYHTMCGDLLEAQRFAKERVAYERAQGPTWLLIQAMSDLAFVLRRAGPLEEMFEVLREGYAIAIEQKHFAAARDCAGKLGSLLEDEESLGSAEWMERARARCGDAQDLHSSFSFNADATRIALRENRLADARRTLDHQFDWEWVSQRRGWHAALVGLRVRLLLAEQATQAEIEPHIQQLAGLYGSTAGLGRQDYEIAALAQGLAYINKETEAELYVRDYIADKRRDLTPLSKELIMIVRSLGTSEQSTWSTAQ